MKIFTNEEWFTKLLIILGTIGLGIFVWKTWIDYLPQTKGEANKLFTKIYPNSAYENVAINFANKEKIDITQYMVATSVLNDDLGDAFLKRVVGKEKMHDYLETQKLENTTYSVRFFKELETREIFVNIKPNSNKILSFAEVLPENEVRTNLTKEVAQALVEDFLVNNKENISSLELKDYSTNTTQKRIDQYFSFKVKGSEINSEYGEAYVLVDVSVLGDRIGAFNKILFIPENFSRELSKTLSVGDLLAFLSYVVTILLTLASLFVLVMAFIEKKAVWKPFLYLFLGIFFVLFLDTFNNFDLLLSTYPTDMYLNVYLISSILYGLFFGATFIALMVFSGIAGNYLDKTTFQHKLSNLKNYKMDILRGYFIAFLSLGITAILYYLGEKYLDLWTYGVVENYSIHLSLIPLISGIYIALSSSFSEEIIFRYFGFLFANKYLKNVFFAGLISVFIWALGHSNYPVFPIYFRGIELLIGGMIWMYFVLRYNILTTITAHFVFNGVLFAIPMLLSVGFVNLSSGMILIFTPALAILAKEIYGIMLPKAKHVNS